MHCQMLGCQVLGPDLIWGEVTTGAPSGIWREVYEARFGEA